MNVLFASEGSYTIVVETSENNGKTWREHNEIILPVTLINNDNNMVH